MKKMLQGVGKIPVNFTKVNSIHAFGNAWMGQHWDHWLILGCPPILLVYWTIGPIVKVTVVNITGVFSVACNEMNIFSS